MLNNGKRNHINCTVGTCSHHSPDNSCTANGIKVGTEYALDKTETFCATYSHKD